MAFLPWPAGKLAENVGQHVIPQFVFPAALLTFFWQRAILWREILRPLAQTYTS